MFTISIIINKNWLKVIVELVSEVHVYLILILQYVKLLFRIDIEKLVNV